MVSEQDSETATAGYTAVRVKVRPLLTCQDYILPILCNPPGGRGLHTHNAFTATVKRDGGRVHAGLRS